MERLVRFFQVASSPVAVITLVAVNLVPLAGVLFWGWNVYTLLILYWVENGIVGALAVARIIKAAGPIEAPGVRVKLTGATAASKAVIVPFFLVHYGMFWFVHGVFVFALPLFLGIPQFVGEVMTPVPGSEGFSVLEPGESGYEGPRWDVIAVGAVGLAISHLVSFALNYLGRGEYLTTSGPAQAMAPYGRVVILHMTIILGVLVSLFLGSPVGSVAVLVAVKTIIDLALHLAEHRKAAAPTLFAPA